MNWEEYVTRGILEADREATHIDEGVIKPTYMIDDGSDSYVLQTVDEDDEWRLHQQRAIYERLEGTDVPVPEVIHDAADETVPYQVVEAVDGEVLEEGYGKLSEEALDTVVADAGRYLAQAHEALSQEEHGELRGTAEGLEVEATEDWRAFYQGFLEHHIDMIEDGPLDRDGLAEYALERVEATIEEIPEEPYAAVVHRDYRPGNLMAEGDCITGILDWDNAFSGDPRYDVARAEQSFASRFDGDRQEAVRELFRDAYEEADAELDERLHEHYHAGALLDQGAALTWLIDQGFEFSEDVVSGHAGALRSALEEL